MKKREIDIWRNKVKSITTNKDYLEISKSLGITKVDFIEYDTVVFTIKGLDVIITPKTSLVLTEPKKVIFLFQQEPLLTKVKEISIPNAYKYSKLIGDFNKFYLNILDNRVKNKIPCVNENIQTIEKKFKAFKKLSDEYKENKKAYIKFIANYSIYYDYDKNKLYIDKKEQNSTSIKTMPSEYLVDFMLSYNGSTEQLLYFIKRYNLYYDF